MNTWKMLERLKAALAKENVKALLDEQTLRTPKSPNICGSEWRGSLGAHRVLAEVLNVWEQRWQVWWPAQPCSGISLGLVILWGVSIRIVVKS